MLIAKPIQVLVERVLDGDTLLLTTGERLRANYIDAPELSHGKTSNDPLIIEHWYWGNFARDFLIKLIIGKPLIIIAYGQDSYGRWLSDWYINSISLRNNIQLAIARLGFCAYYQPWQKYDFSPRDLSLYLNILKYTIRARQAKIGYWSVPNPILPHEVRLITGKPSF